MTLLPLILIIGLTLVIGLIAQGKFRSWSLLVASIAIIYWLQPSSPIRHVDFWLPTACLGIAIIAWAATCQEESQFTWPNLITGGIIAIVILAISLTRYLGPVCCLTPSPPPAIGQVAIAFGLILLVSVPLVRFGRSHAAWIYAVIVIILVLFVVLKSEPLAKFLSMGLRSINNQPVSLASGLDIRWLGFSYVAFRLLHTLRDRLSGRLPGLSLQDYIIYVIFFPAFTAGPIDRVQHFVQDLQQPVRLSTEQAIMGGKRISLGVFSKFVLADGLAIIALNNANINQVSKPGWLWIMLYAFALRIFFDFSGYTAIAIGLGHLLGIQLPENFDRPYLKPNLTQFWNSWHMTLAGWFRAYFFNPLTRALRSRQPSIPLPAIIFIGQLSTFTLIGLWHGISWNFALWGAWHGLGLFIHNRWTELIRLKGFSLDNRPRLKWLAGAAGTLLTFHYVSLGWVWFVLATPEQSWRTFLKLFGLA